MSTGDVFADELYACRELEWWRTARRLRRPDKLASRTDRPRWWIVRAEAGGVSRCRIDQQYPVVGRARTGGRTASQCDLDTARRHQFVSCRQWITKPRRPRCLLSLRDRTLGYHTQLTAFFIHCFCLVFCCDITSSARASQRVNFRHSSTAILSINVT